MCTIFGLGAGATLAIVAVGCMVLGLSIPSIFKAGLAWFKHKFNLDEPKAPAE